jgi:hypothetical protein
METTPDKEKIYDEQINPLMASIIEICREHKIAMFATFQVPNEGDPDLVCTSCTPDEKGTSEYHKRCMEIVGVVERDPQMLKITNPDGSTTLVAFVD